MKNSMQITKIGLNWLLSSRDPSIRYRAQHDLLEIPPDSSIKKEISESKNVKKIFSKMHSNGYWLHRGIGAGIDYAMCSSTHFVLSYLAELGITKSDPRIDMAVNRYLNLKMPDKWLSPPDHFTGQSCLYAHNIRTFILLGYKNDKRVKERINTLLNEIRHDNGYLCRRKSFNSNTKSCIRGTVKALMAYAELPLLWNHDSCQKTVDYFLKRNIYYKLSNLSEKIRGGMPVGFPFSINCSLLEPLYALSKMGFGNHKALSDGWKELDKRCNSDGQFKLDWFAPAIFIPGKKNIINEWATLYAYLAIKFRYQVDCKSIK